MTNSGRSSDFTVSRENRSKAADPVDAMGTALRNPEKTSGPVASGSFLYKSEWKFGTDGEGQQDFDPTGVIGKILSNLRGVLNVSN